MRTEIDFLCEVTEAAIDAGATTINIPDTVGYTTPKLMFEAIQALRQRVPNIAKAVLSVHCHNDLGLAVANSLAAIRGQAGRMHDHGSANGPATALELVMALHPARLLSGPHAYPDAPVPASRLWPALRACWCNAARRRRRTPLPRGGHPPDGMLKERTTYEIMRPEDVSFAKTDLVLGSTAYLP